MDVDRFVVGDNCFQFGHLLTEEIKKSLFGALLRTIKGKSVTFYLERSDCFELFFFYMGVKALGEVNPDSIAVFPKVEHLIVKGCHVQFLMSNVYKGLGGAWVDE